jgi:protein tyrosine/serine phosphatase
VRVAIYIVVLATLLAAVWVRSLRFYFLGDNLHAVIPHEVYRSAQPSPAALERWIRELGIRTAINLRGESSKAWFKAERGVAEAHRVDFYSLPLANGSMPHRKALQQLVHLLDTARRPILLHCAQGIERSSIASAVAVLLTGGDVMEARKQFGLIYGYVPGIDEHPKMLDDYEQWLAMKGWSHTPARFRYWVENDYVPYFFRARIEPLNVPASIAKGSTVVLLFRVTNTSPQPWRFRSEHKRGIHLGAKVRLLDQGVEDEIQLRGGFRDLTVAPGETVVLEMVVPPLSKAGRYHFSVDLLIENVQWFSSVGSDPYIFELLVES